MPLPDRMKLADGKPLPRRMMAAMAQQDCSQCGYNCKDYAEALFAKKELRLNLCVPGGKETARMLKTLYAELGAPRRGGAGGSRAGAGAAPSSAPGRSRDNPVYATFLSRRRLNKEGSRKGDLAYRVRSRRQRARLCGRRQSSASIRPTTPRWSRPSSPRSRRRRISRSAAARLREVLTDGVSLSPAPDMLFQLISYITGGDRKKKAKALADGQDPDGDAATLDVLAALQKFPGIRPDPEAFIEALDPLQPRVYSISSSLKLNPGRVSLTVDAVRYQVEKRTRLGVASTFLAGRVNPGDKIRVYVQKAQHFALPADPGKPIIMIGPGTGLAPFRAFLQERQATDAPGPNWLYFGHQRSDYDFFYEDELKEMRKSGLLTRLTLAWSRDGDEKIYVQHRMRDDGRDLWDWLAQGRAHLCLRRRAAHGQGRRARADRRRGRARQALTGRRRALRRRAEEERPLSGGCVLANGPRSGTRNRGHHSHALPKRRSGKMEPLARLPVFLALEGKRAVLAGGSAAAAWKAELLSAAGARVDVYADAPSDELLQIAGDPPRGAIVDQSASVDGGRLARRGGRHRRVRRR